MSDAKGAQMVGLLALLSALPAAEGAGPLVSPLHLTCVPSGRTRYTGAYTHAGAFMHTYGDTAWGTPVFYCTDGASNHPPHVHARPYKH